MCVRITTANPTAVQRMTGLEPVQDCPVESFPGYAAPIICTDADASPGLSVDLAVFGLIQTWSKDRGIGRRTYSARTEAVTKIGWSYRCDCYIFIDQFLIFNQNIWNNFKN